MMRIAALLLCVFAFAALATAMERHQQALFGRPLPAAGSRGFRVVGWGALLGALWLLVADEGWALGLVDYSGSTSVAAGVVYGALIVRERWFARR
jgi:hypothetical protein